MPGSTKKTHGFSEGYKNTKADPLEKRFEDLKKELIKYFEFLDQNIKELYRLETKSKGKLKTIQALDEVRTELWAKKEDTKELQYVDGLHSEDDDKLLEYFIFARQVSKNIVKNYKELGSDPKPFIAKNDSFITRIISKFKEFMHAVQSKLGFNLPARKQDILTKLQKEEEIMSKKTQRPRSDIA